MHAVTEGIIRYWSASENKDDIAGHLHNLYIITTVLATLFFAIPSWMTTHIIHSNTNNLFRIIFVFTDSIVGLIRLIVFTRNKNKKDTINIIDVTTKYFHALLQYVI